MHDYHQQNTEQGDQHACGVAFDEARRSPANLFCCGGGCLRCLGPLLGGLPRLLLIPFALLALAPQPGKGIFLFHFRVLQHRLPKMVIRRSLDRSALGLFYRPRRMGTDALLGEAHRPPASGLGHKLGAVGPLGSHILMLHLVNLAMREAVNAPPGEARRPSDRAGGLVGLLPGQLVPGRVQLVAPLLHTEPGFSERVRLRGGGAGIGASLAVGRGLGASATVTVELISGPGLPAVPPKLLTGHAGFPRFPLAVLAVLRDSSAQTALGSFGTKCPKVAPLRCASSPHKVYRLCGGPIFRSGGPCIVGR